MRIRIIRYLAIVSIAMSIAFTSCDKQHEGKPIEYIVTFNSNEGSTALLQTVEAGKKATKPDNPIRSGYEFVAWYKEAELRNEWDFDVDVVTAAITLYAKWVQVVFTVSFNSNGGSAVLPQSVGRGGWITKPEDPTRDGHLFAAWYKEQELITNWSFFADVVYTDITLYAKWNAIHPLFKIPELTLANYPRVDGSTSTTPLNVIVACKLLNFGYDWAQHPWTNTRTIEPNLKDNSEIFWEQIKSSQTHQAIINLIDNKADLILSAREMSSDEKEHANSLGIGLIESPIALDALIFIVHPSNPIQSLTTEQIQDIYMGKITNWKEVGGIDAQINPYVRNTNSGSQELMESLVMRGLDIIDFPTSNFELLINTMVMVFEVVTSDPFAICYTLYYYKEQMITGIPVKTIAIDNINPDEASISDSSYPHTSPVFASIRSDLDNSSMAYKLYELLQTADGKRIIEESGYVPK